MVPRLGQKVFLIDFKRLYAYKVTVGYIGKNSFVVKNYSTYPESWQGRYYRHEGKTWFANLASLKHAYPNVKYIRNEGFYMLNRKE